LITFSLLFRSFDKNFRTFFVLAILKVFMYFTPFYHFKSLRLNVLGRNKLKHKCFNDLVKKRCWFNLNFFKVQQKSLPRYVPLSLKVFIKFVYPLLCKFLGQHNQREHCWQSIICLGFFLDIFTVPTILVLVFSYTYLQFQQYLFFV
jgi:hypothetical protein